MSLASLPADQRVSPTITRRPLPGTWPRRSADRFFLYRQDVVN